MARRVDFTSYYVDDHPEIKRMMDEVYRSGIPLVQQFWNEADIDTRFKCGDQTLWNQIYGTLPLQNRRMFQFNRTRRLVNLPAGYQRRNRKTTVVVPIEGSDQQTADDFSAIMQWCHNKSGIYEAISDSFEGALTTGFNILNVWMDYREDPVNGDIRVTNYYHNGIFIDPTFKKKDFSDCNYIWTRKWLSQVQAASLFPDRKEEILSLNTLGYRDDKFMFLPENYQYSLRGLVPYDEFYYLGYRSATMIIDRETGETIEWDGEELALRAFLKQYPQLMKIETQKQTCRLAICINGIVFYDGPNPMGIDRYPFVGFYCYFEPEIPYYAMKMQGIVRGLRDAQYIYNRKMVIMNDILESQINSGLKFKESALKDPRDAFLNGQGRMLAIKDTASIDDVQQIPPPEISASMMELSKVMGQEIQEISGINEELLGMADDDKAGILSMLRQGAGLTSLQTLFDQLDSSQKQIGMICLDLIQANFTPQKVARILGRQPSQQFYDKNFQKYDCNVEEGALTTSQKQMQFLQLMQVREMGIPVPTNILLDTLQIQNKNQLLEAIQQQEQQQSEIDQAQLQQQMQEQEIVNNSLSAKAESDRALASERLAKIQLDQALNVERLSRAQTEKDAATLDRIRAIKELTEMDISQLQRMLQLVESIKQTVS